MSYIYSEQEVSKTLWGGMVGPLGYQFFQFKPWLKNHQYGTAFPVSQFIKAQNRLIILVYYQVLIWGTRVSETISPI